MGVVVQWDDEAKTMIRQIYDGNIILDDYYIATDEFVKLAKSVPHTVHSIMDRRSIRKTSGSLIQVMRYANNKMPENVGLRIVIQPNMLTKIMVDMGQRLAPKLIANAAYCNTLEEAHQLVKNFEAKNDA